MPCCNCHCSPCTCHTTEIRVPAPEARVYHMPGDLNCCPIKGWYETLSVSSWTPPAAGASTLIAVCDATQYPVGTCVKISDGASSAVLKVTGWNQDKDAIYVLGYDNAENTGGTMSGNINSFPLAICPLETQEGGTVCDRDYMVTAEAFVMPTAITSSGGTTAIVFDAPQTLQIGMSIYVAGAGFMEVSVPPGGEFVACGTEFYVYNSGTYGNAGAGTTIPAGAAAYPQVPPAIAEADTETSTPVVSYAYGLTGTYRLITAAGSDADLTVTLTGVKTDDLVEVWGELNVASPRMELGFTIAGTSSPSLIAGIVARVDDGDGQTRTPYVHVHRKVVMKATADGTLTAKWAWANWSGACSGGISERNIFARVIGNNP